MRKTILTLLALLVSGLAVPAVAEPARGAAQLETRAPAQRVERQRVAVQPQRAARPHRRSTQRAGTNRPANVVRYTGYFYGVPNPNALADIIARRLARDPTGTQKLDAAKCARDGSCASPMAYLVSLQAHDPHGGWTLENLVEKLRRLELRCNINGVFQMDRIAVMRDGTVQADVNGMSRGFTHGTENGCAWVNPDTGQPVLAPDCTNPVGVRVDLDCVYINAEIRNPAEFALIWARYDREDDQCFAYRFTSRLFEADSPNAVWYSMPRGCVGRPCTLDDANRVLGRHQLAQGQIPVRPGFVQIRIARNARVVLCLKHWADGGIASSFSADVSWQRRDYRLIADSSQRAYHARVYYNSNELRAGGLRLDNGARVMAWYASTARDEAIMQGLMDDSRPGE